MKLVGQFNKAMNAQPEVFSNIFPMPSTNFIAVLRFQHIESDLQCDLNFKSGMSTTNTKLVKYVYHEYLLILEKCPERIWYNIVAWYFRTYLQIDPRVRYVIIGIRLWMQTTELKLSYLSCTQTWLALFFLMKRNVVPSVQTLRKMMPTSKQTFIIEGKQVGMVFKKYDSRFIQYLLFLLYFSRVELRIS